MSDKYDHTKYDYSYEDEPEVQSWMWHSGQSEFSNHVAKLRKEREWARKAYILSTTWYGRLYLKILRFYKKYGTNS